MNKKLQIAIVIIIILILVCLIIFFRGYFFKKSDLTKCGDSICSLNEDCNSCPTDCGCKNGEVCSSVGVCKNAEVCGDEICSEQEKTNDNCCGDCGCKDSSICNKITQKCQVKIVISNDTINRLTQEYLTKNNLTGTIHKITDSYHKEQAVKVVSIDCKATNSEYPCEIVLFINSEESIIDEMRTA